MGRNTDVEQDTERDTGEEHMDATRRTKITTTHTTQQTGERLTRAELRTPQLRTESNGSN